MRNIFLIIIFFVFAQCGFKPIFSTKEVNFKIETIKSNNEIDIIENRLYFLNTTSPKFFYNLDINYSEAKSTLSKNSQGKPLLLRMEIKINLLVIENDKVILEKDYVNNFDYQNLDKKFELADYEDDIKKNMLDEIANKILIDLTDLK
tara:strand:+ start:519 stop:962 length:444 start_codon:yes stop_codon:yes gene_type:complete